MHESFDRRLSPRSERVRPESARETLDSGDPDPVELLREGRADEVRKLIEAAKQRHAEAIGASA
jgi:hypothetical protein